MAYKRKSPTPIVEGGTNATSMATTDGVVYFDGTSLVTTAVGTATNVLTSNGAGLAPTFQAAGGGGITTLAGDSGTATGSTVTLLGGSGSGSGSGNGIITSATASTVTIEAAAKQASFFAYLSANQTIVAGPGGFAIAFNTVLVNNGSAYIPATGNFFVPYDGLYFFSCGLLVTNATTSDEVGFATNVSPNEPDYVQATSWMNSTATTDYVTFSAIKQMTAGDVMYVVYYNNSGAVNATIIGGNNAAGAHKSWFCGYQIL